MVVCVDLDQNPSFTRWITSAKTSGPILLDFLNYKLTDIIVTKNNTQSNTQSNITKLHYKSNITKVKHYTICVKRNIKTVNSN